MLCFLDALLAEVNVGPTGEEVELVPFALAVTEQHEFNHSDTSQKIFRIVNPFGSITQMIMTFNSRMQIKFRRALDGNKIRARF